MRNADLNWHRVRDFPTLANKDLVLKRVNKLESLFKKISMRPETDDGLSNYSQFPERLSSYELESNKPILPEIEHLRDKIGDG